MQRYLPILFTILALTAALGQKKPKVANTFTSHEKTTVITSSQGKVTSVAEIFQAVNVQEQKAYYNSTASLLGPFQRFTHCYVQDRSIYLDILIAGNITSCYPTCDVSCGGACNCKVEDPFNTLLEGMEYKGNCVDALGRHGELWSETFHWDEGFETLCVTSEGIPLEVFEFDYYWGTNTTTTVIDFMPNVADEGYFKKPMGCSCTK